MAMDGDDITLTINSNSFILSDDTYLYFNATNDPWTGDNAATQAQFTFVDGSLLQLTLADMASKHFFVVTSKKVTILNTTIPTSIKITSQDSVRFNGTVSMQAVDITTTHLRFYRQADVSCTTFTAFSDASLLPNSGIHFNGRLVASGNINMTGLGGSFADGAGVFLVNTGAMSGENVVLNGVASAVVNQAGIRLKGTLSASLHLSMTGTAPVANASIISMGIHISNVFTAGSAAFVATVEGAHASGSTGIEFDANRVHTVTGLFEMNSTISCSACVGTNQATGGITAGRMIAFTSSQLGDGHSIRYHQLILGGASSITSIGTNGFSLTDKSRVQVAGPLSLDATATSGEALSVDSSSTISTGVGASSLKATGTSGGVRIQASGKIDVGGSLDLDIITTSGKALTVEGASSLLVGSGASVFSCKGGVDVDNNGRIEVSGSLQMYSESSVNYGIRLSSGSTFLVDGSMDATVVGKERGVFLTSGGRFGSEQGGAINATIISESVGVLISGGSSFSTSGNMRLNVSTIGAQGSHAIWNKNSGWVGTLGSGRFELIATASPNGAGSAFYRSEGAGVPVTYEGAFIFNGTGSSGYPVIRLDFSTKLTSNNAEWTLHLEASGGAYAIAVGYTFSEIGGNRAFTATGSDWYANPGFSNGIAIRAGTSLSLPILRGNGSDAAGSRYKVYCPNCYVSVAGVASARLSLQDPLTQISLGDFNGRVLGESEIVLINGPFYSNSLAYFTNSPTIVVAETGSLAGAIRIAKNGTVIELPGTNYPFGLNTATKNTEINFKVTGTIREVFFNGTIKLGSRTKLLTRVSGACDVFNAARYGFLDGALESTFSGAPSGSCTPLKYTAKDGTFASLPVLNGQATPNYGPSSLTLTYSSG
jgi:hypothetical protein